MASNVFLAPFIDEEFQVTAGYPNYPDGDFHGGLDLSTGKKGTAKLYSLFKGVVTRKGIDTGVSYGNYIEIKRNDGVRCLFGHMVNPTSFNVGDTVLSQQEVGLEGTSRKFYRLSCTR